ncbi:MAG: dihydropyrimidinase [Proteobacteria bacterium]|nr:MAG: dihydropyrimidinase [Pseudomonadota bacterium]
MAILIRGGEIITASERYHGDVLCEGEEIARIAPTIRDGELPTQTTILDAKGKLVFPGFIDPHTHVYLPVSGTEANDDFASATRAALLGGTTCLFDFIGPAKDEAPFAALEAWESRAAQAFCDVGFHLAVTRLDEDTEPEIRSIVRDHGHRSFKVYLANYAVGIDDDTLFRTLELARELEVLTMAHCENGALIKGLTRRLRADGKLGPRWHYHSRPPRVEAVGTALLLAFAELLDVDVYLVHVSCAEALDEVQRARLRGVRASVETLAQFLLLDRQRTEVDDFEAAKHIASPPLRDAENHAVLWNALASGAIDTLATDHAPFDFCGQKDLGADDFSCIPNGMPGVEDRIKLLYTHGVCRGRLNLNRFVDVCSTRAAKLFGLYPHKGTVQPGADADLVVWDPRHRSIISAEHQAMKVDYNAFEGFSVEGRAEHVTVRGELAVRDGAFCGTPGRGAILRRTLSTTGG